MRAKSTGLSPLKQKEKTHQSHFNATSKLHSKSTFFRQNKKGVLDLFRFAAKQRESKRGSWTPLTFFIRGGKNGFWWISKGRLSALNRLRCWFFNKIAGRILLEVASRLHWGKYTDLVKPLEEMPNHIYLITLDHWERNATKWHALLP